VTRVADAAIAAAAAVSSILMLSLLLLQSHVAKQVSDFI